MGAASRADMVLPATTCGAATAGFPIMANAEVKTVLIINILFISRWVVGEGTYIGQTKVGQVLL